MDFSIASKREDRNYSSFRLFQLYENASWRRMAILMLRFDLSPGRLFSKLSFFFGIERKRKEFDSMIYVKL